MLATTAATVSVNAAFLQEIKADHQELHLVISRLSSQLREVPSPADWKIAVDLFHKLRDCLGMHFALEEGYGYCEDAIAVAPRLSVRANALRSEHEPLFVRVQQLVERAEQSLYQNPDAVTWGELPSRYQAFVEAFETHERAECDLILEAYDLDLGSGD